MKRAAVAGYALFFCAAVVVSVMLRFPAADLGRVLAAEVQRRSGGLARLTLGRCRYGWPLALVCDDASLSVAGRPAVPLDQLRLAVAPLESAVLVAADLLGGSVDARFALRKPVVEAVWRRLDCGGLWSGVQGKSDGRLRLVFDGRDRRPSEGSLLLSVANGRLLPQQGVFTGKGIDFGAAVVRLRFAGTTVKIEEARWRGRSVSGEATGEMRPAWPLVKSEVEVGGRLRVHPEFVPALRRAGLLPSGGRTAFAFRLTGPLDDWQVRLMEGDDS